MKTPSRADGKARKMYVTADFFPVPAIAVTIVREADVGKRHKIPVAISELSENADSARIEAGARAIFDADFDGIESWHRMGKVNKDHYRAMSRACFASANLLTPVSEKQGKK